MCNLANDCQDIGGDLIEGYQPAEGEVARLLENRVTPDYFATVGMRLLSGRSFDDRDSLSGAKVAIVNEAAMRKYFHGTNPIGKRIDYSALDTLIVGAVRDARVLNLRAALIPMAYYPLPKSSGVYSNIVVKVIGDPGAIAAAIPKAIARVDPDVPVGIVRTLDEQLDRGVVQDRLIAYLTSAFGGRRPVARRHRAVRCDGLRRREANQRDRRADGDWRALE